MSAWQKTDYPQDKMELYRLLEMQLSALMEGESEPIPNLANASALLFQALENVNWAGFYLMKDGVLVLGPFQGAPACIRIPMGRGVCGTAAQRRETQRVADVRLFPGHIACDAQSCSEIVIPLVRGKDVVGVLDIDSPIPERFDEADQRGLEALARRISQGCAW